MASSSWDSSATGSSAVDGSSSPSSLKPKHRLKPKPSGILKNSKDGSSPRSDSQSQQQRRRAGFNMQEDSSSYGTKGAAFAGVDAAATASNGAFQGSYQSTGNERRKRKTRGIQWDENTLAEHDKERGTRMRIREPKTPFEGRRNSVDSMDSTDGNSCSDEWDHAIGVSGSEHDVAMGDWDALSNGATNSEENHNAESPPKTEFEAARAAHYKEEAVKAQQVKDLLKRRGKPLEDELDSDDEDQIKDGDAAMV
eukprot:gb/GECG01001273.1/.p1 GENE.gb/GECG01001273.1/~~gb/GECG01001273.1/.p1  ORF type:complete len:253 (+),score=53.54 gb/GECG01001273.1/:1-759(+)